jgi:V8-like Glu-specific endopeptidase
MFRSIYSVAAAAFLISQVTSSPVNRDGSQGGSSSAQVGYDPDLVRILSDDDIIPEGRYVDFDELRLNQTFDIVEPFIPDEDTSVDATTEKRYINGADDRYVYSSTAYPFAATGKLYWSNGVFCSGALIGPRHVLTAKHCLVEGASGTFAPGFDNGARLGSGQVTLWVTTGIEWGTPCGWKGDWAVLILDNRLGDQYGYFGAKLPDPGLKDRAIFNHIGYPGDRDNGNRPYRTPGNTVQSFRPWDCDSTGPFYTDTDCMGGQSGGPHWQDDNGSPYIWGTLSVTFGQGSTAWAGWGSGNEMLDTIGRLRAEFP